MDKHIYIIHENDEWVVPLREELKKINAPYKEWHIGKDKINSSNTPPNGVFYNRMSEAHIHEDIVMHQRIQKWF